jgi:hypothetical protein
MFRSGWRGRFVIAGNLEGASSLTSRVIGSAGGLAAGAPRTPWFVLVRM